MVSISMQKRVNCTCPPFSESVWSNDLFRSSGSSKFLGEEVDGTRLGEYDETDLAGLRVGAKSVGRGGPGRDAGGGRGCLLGEPWRGGVVCVGGGAACAFVIPVGEY